MSENTFRICVYLPEEMRKRAEEVRAMLQSFGSYVTIEEIEEKEE